LSPHILIFDSSLGGVSILEEVAKKLPKASFSYFMDNAAFPYGEKPDQWLRLRARQLFTRLFCFTQPDLIILACNTASTLFLDDLRKMTATPIIGVVPAIKPAALLTKTQTIGLLATKATTTRAYIDDLHSKFGLTSELIRFNAQPLVKLAEDHLLRRPFNEQAVVQLVDQFFEHPKAKQIDTWILGCTHFPIVKDTLVKYWPNETQWVDSGTAIANRAASLCTALSFNSDTEQTLFHTYPKPFKSCPSPLVKFDIHLSQLLNI
jgi:glutamate racemase